MSPYKKIYISLATFGAIILLFLFLVYLPWAAQIKKSAEDLIFQKEAFFSLKESLVLFLKGKFEQLLVSKPRQFFGS